MPSRVAAPRIGKLTEAVQEQAHRASPTLETPSESITHTPRNPKCDSPGVPANTIDTHRR